jgi:hypothetical protein
MNSKSALKPEIPKSPDLRRSRNTRRAHKKNQPRVKFTNFEIVRVFLELLNTVKIYHWNTFSYPEHKATDELYASLGEHIDKFVEVMLGKYKTRILFTDLTISIPNIENTARLETAMAECKVFLEKLGLHLGKEDGNGDLVNIRDEILADINKFLYLLTLNK